MDKVVVIAKEAREIVWHPHHRHKIILFVAYTTHVALEHADVGASAGIFYYVLEILHTLAG